MKKTIRIVAVLAAASLAVVGAVTPASASTTKACLALDTGGVDDKSFNASAWAGAQAAAKSNSSVTVKYLAATSDADYAPNIKKLVDEKCNIIVGVGFLINGAIVAAAKANPTVNFAIVDQDGEDHGADGSVYPGTKFKNLKPLQFNTNESAFQAGYLAAGACAALVGPAGRPLHRRDDLRQHDLLAEIMDASDQDARGLRHTLEDERVRHHGARRQRAFGSEVLVQVLLGQ